MVAQALFIGPQWAAQTLHNGGRAGVRWQWAKATARDASETPISTASAQPADPTTDAVNDATLGLPAAPERGVEAARLGDAAQAAASLVLARCWAQAQDGDERAYCEALRLLAARLRAFLRHRLMSAPHEVEDLVQETLLALHLQRGTHDANVPVAAWALAIARHKLIDHWRRHGRREARHDPIDDVDEAHLAAATDPGEARRDLGELMQGLPVAQRQAIELTKIEGLTVAEAAKRTGHSVAAIKVQVHRGLKRLAAAVRASATSSNDAANATRQAREQEARHAD
jgi:RNA polymerase sigma-70 factor, ECF subfamily